MLPQVVTAGYTPLSISLWVRDKRDGVLVASRLPARYRATLYCIAYRGRLREAVW